MLCYHAVNKGWCKTTKSKQKQKKKKKKEEAKIFKCFSHTPFFWFLPSTLTVLNSFTDVPV